MVDRRAEQMLQRRYYEMLLRSQWWTPEQLAEYQRRQLNSLLKHAHATVPFYRERLQSVFRPDGSIDFSRWHEVPITRRADVSVHGHHLRSEAPPDHGAVQSITTSGSSGDPITVHYPARMTLFSHCCRWRAHTWHGLDWSKTRLARQPDRDGFRDGQAIGPWGPPWDAEARKGDTIFVGQSRPIDGLLDMLLAVRPAYLANGPRMTEVLVELMERRGETLHLDAILAYGEGVRGEDIQAARRGFGARMVEGYSSSEGGFLASRCPAGGGFHVNAEAVLVEVVDEAGRPVAAGETGSVLITPFANSAMPLIRYEQGDRAVAGSGCSCGRHLPVIEAIAGRTTAVFRHPDGRVKNAVLLAAYKPLLGAGRWQIAQIGPNAYEVRYVPRTWGRPPDIPAFLAAFRSTFFADCNIKLTAVEEIAPTAAGKYLEYVVELSG
jgi:phenylacetate-CoA ligase